VGEDGISVYKRFVPNEWASIYQGMLPDFRALRVPEWVGRGRRH